jgi:Rrf2 family protein
LKFSAKTNYGIVALLELAAEFPGGGVLQIAQIACRQEIPERYLEQMMTSLRKGGFLRSIRGPRGGYQLTRSPVQITIAEVIDCLEGEEISHNIVKGLSPEFLALNALTTRVKLKLAEYLEAISLQDLLEERDHYVKDQTMYFI